MSGESERSFMVKAPDSTSEPEITPSSNHQPMQIYRPAPSPLPGNRPVADNTTDEIDDLLGYLD